MAIRDAGRSCVSFIDHNLLQHCITDFQQNGGSPSGHTSRILQLTDVNLLRSCDLFIYYDIIQCVHIKIKAAIKTTHQYSRYNKSW